MLRRRGASPHEIEDIIQEAAVRVLEARPTYDSADDLWHWAATVTGRLWIDHLRTRRETDGVEHVVLVDATDVAHEVECRMALATTLAAVRDLRAVDRSAIRRALAGARASEVSRREDQRRRVALHKARRRLHLRLEGLIAVLVGFWWRARTRAAGPGASAAMAAGAAVMAVSVMVAPMSSGGPRGGPIAGAPAPRPPVAAQMTDDTVAPPPAPAAPSGGTLGGPAATAPRAASTAVGPGHTRSEESSGTNAAVSYPAPFGTGHVSTRPRGTGEPVACAHLGALGETCVNAAAPALPSAPVPPRALQP